jgi:hypothetical protein
MGQHFLRHHLKIVGWQVALCGRHGALEIAPGIARQAPQMLAVLCAQAIAARLVIEVDGPTHWTDEGRSHDRRRTAYLEANGWRAVFILSGVLGAATAIVSSPWA